MGKGGTLAQDPSFCPDWSIRQEDTCSNSVKAHELRRGYVTPRDRLRFIMTVAHDIEGLHYEAGW